MNNREKGTEKENKAVTYLENRGFSILDRNFYCRHGEIDIVAFDNDILCFVEVKYRKNRTAGYPEEAVSKAKMLKICKSAQYYLHVHKQYMDCQIRFDVIAMDDNDIRFYKNAFDYIGNY